LQALSSLLETLVKNVLELAKHYSNLRKFESSPTFEIERSLAALKLISHLGNTRVEDPLRVVILLARDIHEAAGNYVESGLTLLEYADTLKWSEEQLDGLTVKGRLYEAQTQSQRRELFMIDAMNELERGKDWERCIVLNKQLCLRYDERYEYHKLSALLQKQAELFERIISNDRFFNEYFRVKFTGEGFGEDNGQVFIYRGGVHESLESFKDRLKRRYPHASVAFDDKHVTQGETIFVATVRPSRYPEVSF
jgi:dedicator of cytokinesis protein 3